MLRKSVNGTNGESSKTKTKGINKHVTTIQTGNQQVKRKTTVNNRRENMYNM